MISYLVQQSRFSNQKAFLINNTDKTTGLITANKQIDNKNAGLQMFLIGTATEASTSQASFFYTSSKR